MPGVLAADVRVEVTPDRRLILSGKSRLVLKEDKDFLVDEWLVSSTVARSYCRIIWLAVSRL
jgi:hypothetical protein